LSSVDELTVIVEAEPEHIVDADVLRSETSGLAFMVTVNAVAGELVQLFAFVTVIVPLYVVGAAGPGTTSVIGLLPGKAVGVTSVNPAVCAGPSYNMA